MLTESFVNRVVKVLVEMRLDEGEVKRANKVKKYAYLRNVGHKAINDPTDWDAHDVARSHLDKNRDKVKKYRKEGTRVTASLAAGRNLMHRLEKDDKPKLP